MRTPSTRHSSKRVRQSSCWTCPTVRSRTTILGWRRKIWPHFSHSCQLPSQAAQYRSAGRGLKDYYGLRNAAPPLWFKGRERIKDSAVNLCGKHASSGLWMWTMLHICIQPCYFQELRKANMAARRCITSPESPLQWMVLTLTLDDAKPYVQSEWVKRIPPLDLFYLTWRLWLAWLLFLTLLDSLWKFFFFFFKHPRQLWWLSWNQPVII